MFKQCREKYEIRVTDWIVQFNNIILKEALSIVNKMKKKNN
jgi:uncharacterized protein YeeX (DUF496 family)